MHIAVSRLRYSAVPAPVPARADRLDDIEDASERDFASTVWRLAHRGYKLTDALVQEAVERYRAARPEQAAGDAGARGECCFDLYGSVIDMETKRHVHCDRYCMYGDKHTGAVDTVNIVYNPSSKLDIFNLCVGSVVIVANSRIQSMQRWLQSGIRDGHTSRVLLYHGARDVILDRGMHRPLACSERFVLLYGLRQHPLPSFLLPCDQPPYVLYHGPRKTVALRSGPADTGYKPYTSAACEAVPESPSSQSESEGEVNLAYASQDSATASLCSEGDGREAGSGRDVGEAQEQSEDEVALLGLGLGLGQEAGGEQGEGAVRGAGGAPETRQARVQPQRFAKKRVALSQIVPGHARRPRAPSPRAAAPSQAGAGGGRPTFVTVPRHALDDPLMVHELARHVRCEPNVADVLRDMGVPALPPGSKNVLGREHYDSRHEMRWSVFFKSLGIPYVRDFATFYMDSVQYRPDFLLQRGGLGDEPIWVEIKPFEPTVEALHKCRALSERGLDVALIYGKPALPFAYEGDTDLVKEMASKCARAYVWKKGATDYEKGWGVFVVNEGVVHMEMVTSDPDKHNWNHAWIVNALGIAYHVVP